MRYLAAALVFTVVLLFPASARSQDVVLKPTPDSMVTQLMLRDGTVLIGKVIEVTPPTVRFRSSLGESTIAIASVTSARTVALSAMHDGAIWPEDPSRTRLLFAPTGRMLRASETYFTDAYLFFPGVQTGLTDNISIGGGMSLFPGIGPDEQIFYLTPKVGVVQGPLVNVAVGALVAGAKVLSDYSPFGIGYGVATIGDEESSVTVGAGFGFSRSETGSLGLLMVGGTTRVSRGIALVSENYLSTGSGNRALWSGGVRFIGERLSTDLALAGNGAGAAPYLAFIYRF